MKTTLLALVMLGISVSAQAQTAQEGEALCRPFATVDVGTGGAFAMPEGAGAPQCWGAFGMLEQLFGLTQGGERVLKVCPSGNSNRLQFIKIFLSFASRHPEFARLPFAQVARTALEEAFPCRAS
jgi:hypothetical protein